MALRSTRQWVREQAAFLVVLAALVAAFCYLVTSADHPIRGTLAIAGASLLAAVLRLLLPTASAGMLAVRGRFVDVFFYALFGVLIVLTDLRLKH
ncbi:DUF3017 domain-containing protein [Jatrophihabitans endophyticus]|uniref:DUF3017 domain-containing protein n=1 Tax=Jatrophihabitans endophyticus TaxID=1206085 RepID=UPI0026EFA285|nr:DUF3017 domain-containing protein [Jatrophihabitans endophyticus]